MRRWPLFLIAAPAAVAVWSGWVGLGSMCGFGVVHPLPGILPGFQLDTAITLPVGVESYGAYALGAWLTPGVPEAARTFARRSAVGALALGMLGQVVYHLLAAAHATRAPWPVVVLVACLPVVTLFFAATLTHLTRAAADPAQGETSAFPERAEDVSPAEITPAETTVTDPAEAPAETELAAEDSARSPEPPAPRNAARNPAPKKTRRTPKLTPAEARAKAAEILAADPDISGAKLGAAVGRTERWGQEFRKAQA